MDKLPLEILEFIINDVASYDDFASRADLKNLRLSNIRLEQVAAPRLFKTIPLWMNSESLHTLIRVSEHPNINPLVTGIMFSPLTLDPLLMVSKDDGKSSDRSVSMTYITEKYGAQLDRHRKAVDFYHYDHCRFFAVDQGKPTQNLLVRALQALSNLTRLEIDSDRSKIGARDILDRFGAGNLGGQFTKSQTAPLELLFIALIRAEKSITIFRQGAQKAEPSRQEELRLHYQHLDTPDIYLTPRQRITNPDILCDVIYSLGWDTQELTHLLSGLTEITTRDSNAIQCRPNKISGITRSLNLFCRYTNRLRILNFDVYISLETETTQLQEQNMPPRQYLFRIASATYRHVIALFRQHAETLESVTLQLLPAKTSDHYNDDIDRMTFAHDLRECSWPRLNNFTLSRSEDRSILQMQDHLKGTSVADTFPVWSDCSFY